jgi:molybdopterin converting factor small subunit
MRVTLTFLGSLRSQLGTGSLAVDISDGGDYREVLDQIEETMRTRLESSSWDVGRRAFSRRMMVLLNGTSELRDDHTVLADGDEIVVVLPLAGG